MNLLFVKQPKYQSHEAKVLAHLKKAGHFGAYSYELARPTVGGLAWHRRITDLRKDGERISTVRISRSVFKYFYDGEEK